MAELWRQRDFRFFWASQALSVAGDAFGLVAIPLLVLGATGSVSRMTELTALSGIAVIVAGVVAGPIVDRYDRRRLMIGCDLARTVLFGLVPVLWWIAPRLWPLYLLLPLGEAAGMLFQVAYVTAVPNLPGVGRERVGEANALLYGTYAVASVCGPGLAGLLSRHAGPAAAIAVDAGTYAASAVGLSLIRLRRPDDGADAPRFGRLLAGVRYLFRQPVLRALTLLLVGYMFLTYGLTDLLIWHVRHDLHRGDDVTGLVLAVGAVGAVAGAALSGRLRRRFGFGPVWIGSVVLCGLLTIPFGWRRGRS